MLIGAIVLGLLAVLVMRFYIGAGSQADVSTAAAVPRSTNIVVAAVAVPAGAELSAAQFKLAAWPIASVPVGSYATLAAIKPGSIAGTALVAGEPLIEARLAGAASKTAGIAA